MNRTRYLTSVGATAFLATLLALATATEAWGRPAPPADDGQPPPITHIAQSSAGMAGWQVVAIAACCAVLAALATLLVVRLVSGRHDRHRRGGARWATRPSSV